MEDHDMDNALKMNELNEEDLSVVNGGLNVLRIVPYTVRYGDNLLRIATDLHSTVEAICTYNVIKNRNSVPAGQVLNIPVLWN